MSIKVIIGTPPAPEKKPVQAKSRLKIRKMLDGSLIIFDHDVIDIVVMPSKSKIVAFAKDEMGDHVYAAQSRLFDFLTNKGVVELGSIRGGNIYGAMEAKIPENTTVDPIQVATFVVGKFIDEERPYFQRDREFEEEFERSLLEPTDEESTELGEVPHEPTKGTQHRYPGAHTAYGLTGMYRA